MKHHNLKLSEFKDIRKAEAKAALKTLTGMLRLFKGGKNWIKGHKEQDGNYCLVGAREAIDGPGEALAQCIMLQALNGSRYRVISEEPVLTGDGFKFKLAEDNTDLLLAAGFDVIDEDLTLDEEEVTGFNDNELIKFPDIKRFLGHCIGFTERLVASKSA